MDTTSAAAAAPEEPPVHQQLLLQPLRTHDTVWEKSSVRVTLSLRLDGCIVPTAAGGARVDYAHLVVLDSFLDEPTRLGLLDFITQPGWPTASASPPASKWERATADAAAKPATWGLRPEVLAAFAAQDMAAKLEVQSRLSKLYPDMLIAHMPSGYIQAGLPGQHEQPHQPQPPGSSPQQGGGSTHQLEQQQQHLWTAASVDCSCFLANAAVAGDQFSWHVDADPQSFPVPTPWSEEFGLYCNREPGKPLFVSLLLYLDGDWPRENDAETLFLDSMTDTGVFVRPKRYRAVLMDQDVVHRLSTPSAAAGRPRYSLVWKLVMLPKALAAAGAVPRPTPGAMASDDGQDEEQQQPPAAVACIARPEWGRPTYFGSAAAVERVARQAAGMAAH